MYKVSIQHEDFSLDQELALMANTNSQQGAQVSFIGKVRADDSDLEALELQHYSGMTESQIQRIVVQAAQQWPLLDVTVIHRIGRLSIGENIVLVVAASAHRQAAFNACEYIMDYLKNEATFWKKELYTSSSAKQANWVEAKDSDRQALAKWS